MSKRINSGETYQPSATLETSVGCIPTFRNGCSLLRLGIERTRSFNTGFFVPAIMLCWLFIPSTLHASDPDDFQFFNLDELRGYFLFQATEEHFETQGVAQDRRIFEELLELGTDGSLYHPNLFDFKLDTQIGYTKEYYFRDGDDGSESGRILGYEFESHLLREKIYGVSVFASETQRWATRAFLPSYKIESTEYGARWQTSNAWLSSRFEITKSKDFFKNYDPFDGRDRRVDDFRIQYEADMRLGEYHTVDIAFDYLENEDSYIQALIETMNFQIGHEVLFGEMDTSRLRSIYQYYEQQGLSSFERHTFSERLHLEHTDALQSWYSYTHEDHSSSINGGGNSKILSDSGNAHIQHKLYKSLTTHLGSRLQRRRLSDISTIDTVGANGSLYYIKKNPWGHLNINYNYDYQRERNNLENISTITVIDEARVFTDPSPIILTSPNVQAASIVITNITNTTTYIQGVDYNVLVLPNQVEISRIPIGGITNGESVLIDYNYQPQLNSETTSRTQHFSIGHNFSNGIFISYDYLDKDYEVDPESASLQNDSVIHTLGAGYRVDTFHAKCEYQTEESNYPYDSYRVNMGYGMQFTPGFYTSLGASWAHTKHTGQFQRDGEVYNGSWHTFFRATRHLDLTSTVTYRDEEDTLYGNSNGLDFRAGLNWSHRKTTLKVEYLSKSYDSQNLDNRSSELHLTLKRVF